MSILNIFLIFLLRTFSNLVKSEFVNSCSEKNTVALTFDNERPYNYYTKKLVNYLVNQEDIKVTFFFDSKSRYSFVKEVQEVQKVMKKAYDHGFQIASLTSTYTIFDEDMKEFEKDLKIRNDFIEKMIGHRPCYLRAPKDLCRERCQEKLEEWDYRLIRWDTDTKDWDDKTSSSIEQRIEDSIDFLKKEFSKEKESYLIRIHDSSNYTVNEIVPWIIEKSGIREKGYHFVTVAECLGDKEGMYRSNIDHSTKKSMFSTDKTHDVDEATQGINSNDIDDDDDDDIINIIKDNNSNEYIITNSTTIVSEYVYSDEHSIHQINSGVLLLPIKSKALLNYLSISITLYFLFSSF
ncbi:glycoside hydrolase/deacetylase [Neocallimastix sp. 'constans']